MNGTLNHIAIAIQTRKNFIQLMDGLSLDDLNRIPHGFNNNIIWNFGHIIASQQKLCYTLGGVTPVLATEYILKYQKGTKPTTFVEQDEVEFLKEQAFILIDKFVKDLDSGLFRNFTSSRLHYGVELNDIQDAILFFPHHDALHLGTATALKKVIEGEKLKSVIADQMK